MDLAEPHKDVTEIQVILHEWDHLLAEGAEVSIGYLPEIDAGHRVDHPSIHQPKNIPPGSRAPSTVWTWTDDGEKKCEVVSHCAHVFPQERIDHLRAIYEKGEFDEIYMRCTQTTSGTKNRCGMEVCSP